MDVAAVVLDHALAALVALRACGGGVLPAGKLSGKRVGSVEKKTEDVA